MEIMFTSPMGTEKRSRESSVGIVSCIPPKKGAQDAGGTENVRLVVECPRPLFCKWTQFLPRYWRERLRFLVCNAVKCDVGCIDGEEGPDVFGFRRAFLVITPSPLFALCKMPFG